MLARLKSGLPYVYLPLLIIVGANLLGLVSRYLIRLLDHVSVFLEWEYALALCSMLIVFYWYLRRRLYRCAVPTPPKYHEPETVLRDSWSAGGPLRELPRYPEVARIIRVVSAIILLLFVLAFVVAVCAVLYALLRAILVSSPFKEYNLGFFLLLTLTILQFALRADTLRSMTWKKLALWMKPPTISGISIMGFGFIATSDTIRNPLLKLTLESEYTNLPLIMPTAFCGVVLMVFAIIVERIGRSKSPDEDGNIPQGWFYSAFGMAFGANIAMFGLLLNSIFLTIHTHYMTQTQTGG